MPFIFGRVTYQMMEAALAELGLIDEYELIVQPRLVGHGPTSYHAARRCR
jgi:hypothetical protein